MAVLDDMMNWDVFFFYSDTGDLDLECRYDLLELVLQDHRSIFYNRRLAVGLDLFENNPNTLKLQILGRYKIASTISYRNSLVSDGSDSLVDRRIAVSQNSINFKQKDNNVDIEILYFLYNNYENPKISIFELMR